MSLAFVIPYPNGAARPDYVNARRMHRTMSGAGLDSRVMMHR